MYSYYLVFRSCTMTNSITEKNDSTHFAIWQMGLDHL